MKMINWAGHVISTCEWPCKCK